VQNGISQSICVGHCTAQTRHRAAVTAPNDLAPLLRLLFHYPGGTIVRSALKVNCLTFVRPGELRKAKWSDIDVDSKTWSFVTSKTKTPLLVPLATQVIAILEELRPLTGSSQYVFPGGRSNKVPMSNNAVLAAMRSVGIPRDQMCGHGFRATARTILDEVLGFRPEIIDMQLAHVVRDSLGRAYNRTQFLTQRREMMQRWADYIESLLAPEIRRLQIVGGRP